MNKRFPADTSIQIFTFLNDKKIDAELYALYQQYSFPQENRTIVKKIDLPTQQEIGEKLGIKSPKTVRSHRNYLIDKGFIVDEGEYYVLPNMEEIYFMIPIDTLKFINDTLKEQIIKIYIYLGQRWKYKRNNWIFTKEEIRIHLGLRKNCTRTYEMINNGLICLKKLGLIDYVEFYETNRKGKATPKMRLTNFSFEVKSDGGKNQ